MPWALDVQAQNRISLFLVTPSLPTSPKLPACPPAPFPRPLPPAGPSLPPGHIACSHVCLPVPWTHQARRYQGRCLNCPCTPCSSAGPGPAGAWERFAEWTEPSQAAQSGPFPVPQPFLPGSHGTWTLTLLFHLCSSLPASPLPPKDRASVQCFLRPKGCGARRTASP